MAKVQKLKITNKNGLVNYGPVSIKNRLELKNELFIKSKKPEECLKLEVVEIDESELVYVEGLKNKSHDPFDKDFVPVAKAGEKIKEITGENENLKSENETLKAQLKALQAQAKKGGDKE